MQSPLAPLESADGSPRRVRKLSARVIAIALAILTIGVALGWSLAVALTPATDPLQQSDHTFATVTPGEVGTTLNLSVSARWDEAPAAINPATGTITRVSHKQGAAVEAGDVLYFLDEVPVVVAEGAVPAFRDLSAGVSGADVRQLQELLAAIGHFQGRATGTFAWDTERAVRAWQSSIGQQPTGIIRSGTVIFIDELPVRISLDREIARTGAILAGGEQLVHSLADAPTFSLTATPSQASMMPAGTTVTVSAPDGSAWVAATGVQRHDPERDVVVVDLIGSEGAICRDACDQVPPAETLQLSSSVATTPTVKGLTVPSAALVTDADGGVYVIDSEDRRHEVRIVESARGYSVIEGVENGLSVRVPAAAQTGGDQ